MQFSLPVSFYSHDVPHKNDICCIKAYDQIQKMLECNICQEIASFAMETMCCGQIFCKRCIEKWVGRHHSCPMCRKYIHCKMLQQARHVQRMASEFKTKGLCGCNVNSNSNKPAYDEKVIYTMNKSKTILNHPSPPSLKSLYYRLLPNGIFWPMQTWLTQQLLIYRSKPSHCGLSLSCKLHQLSVFDPIQNCNSCYAHAVVP